MFLKQVLKQINNNSPELKIAVVIGPEGGLSTIEEDYLENKGFLANMNGLICL